MGDVVTTETISKDHLPRFRVLVTRTVMDTCEGSIESTGWAALADVLAQVAPTGSVPVSPGLLAAWHHSECHG